MIKAMYTKKFLATISVFVCFNKIKHCVTFISINYLYTCIYTHHYVFLYMLWSLSYISFNFICKWPLAYDVRYCQNNNLVEVEV